MADLGERQSPIDIKAAEAVAAGEMAELRYKYDPATIRMVNTGSSWRMDFEADGTNLSGGPLEGDYKVTRRQRRHHTQAEMRWRRCSVVVAASESRDSCH